jgi:hypothetical protein
MALVCSRCGQVYEQAHSCPRCGAATPADDAPPTAVARGPLWLHTSWGRILIGLILAQGLFYGLRHLLTGILLAVSGGDVVVLDELRFLLVLQAIQVVSLLCGGLLAGAGQHNGLLLGALAGAWNGVLAVILRQNPAQELTIVGLYGQPLLHGAFCAAGGMIGAWIWKPIPLAAVPLALSTARKPPPRREAPLFAGPVAWFRVVAGAAFAVAGTLTATMIFQKVLEASGGRLGTTHELQDRIITWELKSLAVLVGGALAGATTSNGFKQGIFVAVGVSLVLVGIQAPLPGHWLEATALTVVSTFSLTYLRSSAWRDPH